MPLPTAMPPDRAKIIGISRHRLPASGDGAPMFGGFEFIAYLKYRYPNGNIRSEGRVIFSEDPQDDLSLKYGEWKYYDIHGNCYRRFWIYEEGGE